MNFLDKYTVRISSKASRDIRSIYQYISNEKMSPENAKGQIDRIKKAILGLEIFPQSHQERTTGIYAGKGYRQLIVDNYIAIFEIKEKSKIVRVITVQHQRKKL
jgi:addiction module RelE/StbE family toxin